MRNVCVAPELSAFRSELRSCIVDLRRWPIFGTPSGPYGEHTRTECFRASTSWRNRAENSIANLRSSFSSPPPVCFRRAHAAAAAGSPVCFLLLIASSALVVLVHRRSDCFKRLCSNVLSERVAPARRVPRWFVCSVHSHSQMERELRRLVSLLSSSASSSSFSYSLSCAQPWQPHIFIKSLNVKVLCGDSFGEKLICCTENGTFLFDGARLKATASQKTHSLLNLLFLYTCTRTSSLVL